MIQGGGYLGAHRYRDTDNRDTVSTWVHVHDTMWTKFRIYKRSNGYAFQCIDGISQYTPKQSWLSSEKVWDDIDKRDENSVRVSVHREERCAAIFDIIEEGYNWFRLRIKSGNNWTQSQIGYNIVVPDGQDEKDQRDSASVFVHAHKNNPATLFQFISS